LIYLKNPMTAVGSLDPADVAGWTVTEVTYDESDIVDWRPVYGHPGVIALTLADYTEGDVIDEDGGVDNLRPDATDPADYLVPGGRSWWA
jgi:hypothetical protein